MLAPPPSTQPLPSVVATVDEEFDDDDPFSDPLWEAKDMSSCEH